MPLSILSLLMVTSGPTAEAPANPNAGKRRSKGRLAVPVEAMRVSQAWLKHGVFGLPLRTFKSFAKDPSFASALNESRFLDLFGESALALFNDLGPIYGKAGQMILSRLSPPLHAVADSLRLTRLYKDWPPLPFSVVGRLLDEEIPAWRSELKVEPHPLGVASLAQVHGAVSLDGREWVVKIIKPQARSRLLESIEALEQMVSACDPLAVTLSGKRLLREMRELCLGFRQELSLSREKATIERVSAKLQAKKQRVLLIPAVLEALCTDKVLVVERFRGVPLSDVVAGKVHLNAAARQKLARDMLGELLLQVFELGLFHADPHAGNLILTPDGSVGLFDWGLSGELLESDRRHIAAILRAVMVLDLEQLIDVLMLMGEEGGLSLERDMVRRELAAVHKLIKKGRVKEGKEGDSGAPGRPAAKAARPSLQQLFEACLKAAGRLGIDVPEGLLLMAKSLITIEGLAKGIDPNISLARVATPVLFRAAKPGFKEFLAMGKRLPQVVKHLFNG